MKEKIYKMYGLVPYNISPRQIGIQYGHALQEYNNKIDEIRVEIILSPYSDESNASGNESLKDEQDYYNKCDIIDSFDKWATEDKTFIILNGGTTNDKIDSKFYGSMNRHLELLISRGVFVSKFTEPDLGDQLTAILVLVDEKIWDRENYPNWPDYYRKRKMETTSFNGFEKENWRKEWEELIGGETQVFLKEFLSQFRLA